ncbi:prepilin-type N-terminal cleavage/methylation domain-containing protein [Sporosarcina sp. E16_8]|uniref:type IV pilus modification PilV family protein n=1 Tax=Sporosarcina sp. E16_8 TaxID=2789295 RepID=UPI001A92ABD7|nr:prepilin-type N-terminal cleavage/methylation domain-containing protein [Sporosarcina sp. E16_8]MBO0587108.1 prepilin-type N-terminal cleavage/methylation domain-containing protein [Sporosarcina sp. E16_8]
MGKFKLKRGMGEGGLTLVEVLAALVIIGIVFIGFMSIFPQMNNINNRTETKLVTMNIAKQELTKLKGAPTRLNPDKRIMNSKSPYFFETYDLSEGNYDILVDCYDTQFQTCSGAGETSRIPKLYKIHIKVEKDGKLNSETFGYLKLE